MPETRQRLPPPAPERVRGRFARLGAEWRDWWRGRSLGRRLVPAACVGLFWLAHLALGGARTDHALVGLAVLAFAYGGPRVDPWFRLLLPLALMAAVYDGQGYVRPFLLRHATVHVAEPDRIERAAFGVRTAEGTLTPAAWWQRHTHPALDVAAGAVYLAFVPAFIGVAVWFRWLGGRLPAPGGARLVRAAGAMTWAFCWLGIVSCATYYVYPAAPPWYADRYGFGPAVLDAPPSAAGAVRVDAALGTTVFAGYYARTPNVFGAIPSLHAAIPLLAFFFACRVRRLRVATGVFAGLMCFAAVYLNHHYVVDLVVGAAYAFLSGWVAVRWREWRAENRGVFTP